MAAAPASASDAPSPAFRFGLLAGAYTRSHFRAQLELTLPLSAQRKLTESPTPPKLTRGCGPKVLKLSPSVSDVSRRSFS